MQEIQDSIEAAKKFLTGKATAQGYKDARGRNKHPIGFKREACEYAVRHGLAEAIKKFAVTESNLYGWMKQYRDGQYDNVPPDAMMVARNFKPKKTDTSELDFLRGQNSELSNLVQLLLKLKN